jgi:hypothetical protein
LRNFNIMCPLSTPSYFIYERETQKDHFMM